MQREMEPEIEDKERDDVTISRMDFRFKFFIGIFHTILYERGHLPEDAFIQTEIFDIDVPMCCHIRVFEYIESCAKRVTCLMETKSLDGFVFNLLYDTQVVQRYVFKISEKYNFSEEPSCGSSLLEMTETARSILMRFKDRLVDVHKHKFCEFARFQIVLGLNPTGIKAMEGGCWSKEEWNPFPWSKMMKNRTLYVAPPIKTVSLYTIRQKSITLDAFPRTNGRPVVKAISEASSSIKKQKENIQEVYFGDYTPLSISIFVLTYFNIDNLDLLTGNALSASLGSDALNYVEPVITVEAADKANVPAAATTKQPPVDKKAKSNLVEPSRSAPGTSPKSVSRTSASTKAVSKASASVNAKSATHSSTNASSSKARSKSPPSTKSKSATREAQALPKTKSKSATKETQALPNPNTKSKSATQALPNTKSKSSTQALPNTKSKSATQALPNTISKSATKEAPCVSNASGSLSKEQTGVSSKSSGGSESSCNGNKSSPKTHCSSSTASASGSGMKRSQSEDTNDKKNKILKTDKRSPSPSPSPKNSPARSKYSISFAPALATKSKGSSDSNNNRPKITYRAAPFSSPPVLTRKFAKMRSRVV